LDAKSPANFFVNECTAAFDASYAYVGANILYCIVLYLFIYCYKKRKCRERDREREIERKKEGWVRRIESN